MSSKLERKYGLFTAICMVAGIVIGSGVFFKAQTILMKTDGNMPLGIIAWLIGGVIMVICASAFGVMASKYEYVSGIVDYGEGYGIVLRLTDDVSGLRQALLDHQLQLAAETASVTVSEAYQTLDVSAFWRGLAASEAGEN